GPGGGAVLSEVDRPARWAVEHHGEPGRQPPEGDWFPPGADAPGFPFLPGCFTGAWAWGPRGAGTGGACPGSASGAPAKSAGPAPAPPTPAVAPRCPSPAGTHSGRPRSGSPSRGVSDRDRLWV